MDYVLTPQTADRLKLLLGQQAGEESGGRPPRKGGRTVLVRCTDATAVNDTAPGNVCYPGVVLLPANDDDVGGPEEVGEVWLTVWGTDGDVVPTLDQVYPCVLSGELELEIDPDTEETETRVRAHAGDPVSGATIGRSTQNASTFDLTSDLTWHDLGTFVADIVLPSAGIYIVYMNANAAARCSANPDGGAIWVRLFSETNGDIVLGESIATSTQVANVSSYGAASGNIIFTRNADKVPDTIRMEALRGNGPTWTVSRLLAGSGLYEGVAMGFAKLG